VGKPLQINMQKIEEQRANGVVWKQIAKEIGCNVQVLQKKYKEYRVSQQPQPEPEPTLEPILEPIPEPILEPTLEPTPEPILESILESILEPAPEPIKTPTLVTVEEKKPTSKPWDSAYNPWTLDRLSLPKSHPGFHPIFIRKKDPDYVRMREEQGYQIADCYDYGLKPRESKGDKFKDSSPDRTIQRGDLILMELPHDLYLKRKEFKRMKAIKAQSRSVTEVERAKAELSRDGVDMKVAPESDHTSFEMPRTYTTTTRP